MKVQTIYNKYKIMPQLQLHMLRVAGVATVIVDSFNQEIDKDSVITAALLHDMGNIIKFKLDLYPESLKPKGLKYWEKVKKDFTNKYGQKEHKATEAIAKDIGVSKNISKLVKNLEFSDSEKIAASKDIRKMIIKYSDLRVSPYGVLSLSDRLMETKKRYIFGNHSKWTESEYNKLTPLWDNIEKQIFYHTKISPSDITDRRVMRLIPKLKRYNIKTK